MVPCFLASPVLSSASDSAWIGLWAPQVSVPGLPTSDREYLGAPLTLPVVQCFYNPATELQNQQESRRFILDRSVFDLVEAHVFLSLTDSRLLNWYLSLCPEDKRIVQAEGSFRQFLQRHPALELTRHHVYVKYSSRAVQQTVTSSRSVESGAKTTGCEPAHTHLDVEMFRRDFSAPGCRNTSGDHLCEELSQRSLHLSGLQDLHLQDSLPWTSSSSVTERPGLQQELSSRDQAVLAGLSLDLDTCSHRPEIRSHISAARDQNVTCCEARPSHSDRPAVNKEPSEYVIQTSGSSVGSENNHPEDRGLQRDRFTDQHQTRNIHSIMEDDGSILVCSPSCLQSDGPQKPSEVSCDVSVGTELLLTASTFTQTEHPETADQQVITEVHMSDLDCLAEEFIRLKTAQVQKEKIKRRGGCDCTERAQKAELNLLGLQYNICRSHIWRLYWEGKQLSSLNKDPPANFTEVLDKLDSDYQDRKREVLDGVPLEQLKPLSVESGKEISGSYTPAQMFADQLGNVSCRTSAEPQQLHAAEPQQLHAAAEPQQLHAAEPQQLHAAAEPQQLHAAAAEPQQLHAAEPQQLHAAAAEPQRLHAAEPQQLHAAEPQQLHAAAAAEGSRDQTKKKMIKPGRAASVILKDGSFLQNKQEGNHSAAAGEEGRSELWFDAEEDLDLPEEVLDLPEEDLDLPEEDLDLPEEDLDLPEEDLDLPEEDLDLPEEDLDLPEEDLDLPEEDLDLPADGRESEGSVLKVSNPPSDVAMTLLKESEASGVRISALKDDQRVAMVTVKELDGGCTLHVDPPRPGPSENLQDPPRPGPSENLQDPPRPGPSENLQDPPRPGPSENLQDPPRPGPSENLQDTPRPGPSENHQDTPRPGPSENLQDPPRPGPSENLQDTPRPGPSENLQDTPRPGPSENLQDTPRPGPSENLQDPPRPGPSENLQDPPRPGPRSPVRMPLPSSSWSRKVVFISPTTRGPCVPQHYGSMGSFDALMSELLQRHPEVGRQRLLDALEELRRKHPGVLTGLPLQTVREMTSQLLTRPDPASQI